MATRIKDGMIPYTGGIGIEITNNHVINVLLRELNNLIHVNEDRELYVDLQLDDGIQPDDDFPVGVTTGKILQEDGWYQSGIILNWKTTSGDYNRLIYANDGNLYIDIGDGEWKLLGGGGGDWFCNVKRFTVNSTSDSTTGQEVIDWILQGKYAILVYNGTTYLLANNSGVDGQRRFISTEILRTHMMSDGYSYLNRPELWLFWDSNNQFDEWQYSNERVTGDIIFANFGYDTPFNPTDPGDPATKKYVDDGLATKQDILTAGTRITIDPVTNVISADVSGVMTYMGNVTDSSQLPASGNQGDCWYDETAKTLRAWDGNRWNDIGGTGIDLTNYFNMQVNDSDDITEGTTNLFVTQQEKNIWNNKQDTLVAGDNITINGNVISATDTNTTYTQGDGIEITIQNVINNTAKFDPENAGSLGQFLKKTNNGYAWADIPGGGGGTSYRAGDGIDITGNVITNTDRFNPTNDATIGYVLKASGRDSYYRAPESGGGGGGGNFNPVNPGTEGQILTKGSGNTYDWKDLELPSGDNNVKFWTINSQYATPAVLQEISDWIQADEQNGAIINDTYNKDIFVYHDTNTSGGVTTITFYGINRNSKKKEWIENGVSYGFYTTAWQWQLDIEINNGVYSIRVWENENDITHTNYISALGAQYPDYFKPQSDSQPATKGYVDAVAAGSVSVPAITNSTTGTTYTVSQIWVGTQAQYDAMQSHPNGIIYNIISSS